MLKQPRESAPGLDGPACESLLSTSAVGRNEHAAAQTAAATALVVDCGVRVVKLEVVSVREDEEEDGDVTTHDA